MNFIFLKIKLNNINCIFAAQLQRDCRRVVNILIYELKFKGKHKATSKGWEQQSKE